MCLSPVRSGPLVWTVVDNRKEKNIAAIVRQKRGSNSDISTPKP